MGFFPTPSRGYLRAHPSAAVHVFTLEDIRETESEKIPSILKVNILLFPQYTGHRPLHDYGMLWVNIVRLFPYTIKLENKFASSLNRIFWVFHESVFLHHRYDFPL